MRNVGIKELKDQASAIVNAGEAVIIEKHGRPVGMYVPLSAEKGDKAKAYEAAQELEGVLTKIVARHGMTPAQWDEELDRLFPEDKQIAPRR